MERERPEQEERELSGVARSQNAVYVLPHDAVSLAQVLEPALDRVSSEGVGVQLLVLTSDAETAVAAARAALERLPPGPSAIPVTSARRAGRVLRARPAAVVAGAPGELLGLLRTAALKLDGVKTVVIAWADTLLDAGEAPSLEAVLAEVPKDAARVLATSRITPGVEQLIERYARRARRVGDLSPTDAPPVALRYVATAPGARAATLRRLLDEIDPERGAVYTRTEEARAEVSRLLAALGVAEGATRIALAGGESAADGPLLVLYELPASRSELRTLIGDGSPTVVALVQPRQLGALRALAGAEQPTPLSLPGPGAGARNRDEGVRQELRAVIADEVPARELLTLEPLLEDFDGIEIAAAALRLLERERQRPIAREAPAARARADAEPGPRERSREDRPPRDERPPRDDRRPREDRSSREERFPRGERGGYRDRSRREERPGRDDRARRDDRFERDRPPRDRSARDRPPRGGAPPRGGPRRDAPDRGPRGEPPRDRDRARDFRDRRERGPRDRPGGDRERRPRYDAE